MTETRQCPKCPSKMIKVLTRGDVRFCPPVFRLLWWCACGHAEAAEDVYGIAHEQQLRPVWEKANAAAA